MQEIRVHGPHAGVVSVCAVQNKKAKGGLRHVVGSTEGEEQHWGRPMQ